MRYLDITTEDKIKALATLEDETQKTIPKKWKNKNGTLTDFCGLKKQKNTKRNPNFSFAQCRIYQHICMKVWISLKFGF